MSRVLLYFLVGLAWIMFYMTVIAGWVQGLGVSIPAPIMNWLMAGSIPVLIGAAVYFFDRAAIKKDAYAWKAVYVGFVVWLILLAVASLLQFELSPAATIPPGFVFIFVLMLIFKKSYG